MIPKIRRLFVRLTCKEFELQDSTSLDLFFVAGHFSNYDGLFFVFILKGVFTSDFNLLTKKLKPFCTQVHKSGHVSQKN